MKSRLLVYVAMTLLGAGAVQNPVRASQQRDTQSRDLVLDLDGPASTKLTKPTVPRGYALVVGVSKYKSLSAELQLDSPEKDAEAIYRVLISAGGGAFPAENVHKLLGSDATLEKIRYELEVWLPSVAQPTDRVVVFFAGHGVLDKEGRGYLAPSDVDPSRLDATAYPMAQLGQVLGSKVKAKWKVLLADACHSGKINPETTNEKLDQQFNGLPKDFLTFTAATERERSYEDPNLSTGYGLFSYYLTQAWQGNADNDPCDGVITANELRDYVFTHVTSHIRRMRELEPDPKKRETLSQTPTAHGDYDPRMLLGVNTSCLNREGSTPLIGAAIVEVNVDAVDVYVDDKLEGKVARNKPLRLPGLATGIHVFKGCRDGYECDTKKILIAPGQDVTVTLRILYPIKNKKSAIELNEQGERLLFTHRSSIDPANIVPVSRTQSLNDLRKAVALFERALADDPAYAKAAFNLGQASQLVGDQDKGMEAYRTAIRINPSFVDARIQYAAVLIESGDTDEAIRQLTEARRLDGSNDELHAMLARAFHDRGAWSNAVESADESLRLNDSNAMAHLWRGDALRMIAAEEKTPAAQKPELYRQALDEYASFLALTNFSSSVGERVAFHFIGMGVGSRRHADREESYRSLRNAGYLGLCLAEQKVGNPRRAREYCQRALVYDKNPMTYFLLGNINRDLYNQFGTCDYLREAASSYNTMLAMNANLQESQNAKNYLTQIAGISRELKCPARS
jgi:tetratricopeptide (TPR) repeat protein